VRGIGGEAGSVTVKTKPVQAWFLRAALADSQQRHGDIGPILQATEFAQLNGLGSILVPTASRRAAPPDLGCVRP
jgi:hypothetical protein